MAIGGRLKTLDKDAPSFTTLDDSGDFSTNKASLRHFSLLPDI